MFIAATLVELMSIHLRRAIATFRPKRSSFIRVSTSCFSNVNLLICSQQAAIAEESSQAFQQISVVGHPNTLRNVTTSLPKKEVNGGDAIIVGELSIDVVHTPGHTDGSLSLLHSPTRYVLEFVACCSEPNT